MIKNNINSASIRNNYLFSCYKDVELIKPGNVNETSPHKDMNADHFKKSAKLSVNSICNENLSLGDRIYKSIQDTKSKIEINTNLGIVLLCSPLIHSMQNHKGIDFESALSHTVKNSSVDDTKKICRAISMANPGGLGQRPSMDVHDDPNVSLLTIMEYASKYDRIAYQYSHNFVDILEFIVPSILEHMKSDKSLDFALTLVFLEIVASIPDSHISRKYGEKIAKKTSNQAYDLLKIIGKGYSQEKAYPEIVKLDDKYKKNRLNPGTSADLLVAGLFVYKCFYDSKA